MKSSLLLIFVVHLLTTTSSCKKTEKIENVGIVGKWQLKEVYDGYVNGGTFRWNSVSFANAHSLLFTQNGLYEKKENISGNNQVCTGTYSLQTTNNLEVLEINSSCNTTIEKMFISELTTNSLIIDMSVIEGKIRYKYSASK